MMHPEECTRYMSEKEILQDSLISQKHMTDSYNTFAGECSSDALRGAMLNILTEEHNMQAQMFSVLKLNGWVQTEPAEAQKINAARLKFAQQP